MLMIPFEVIINDPFSALTLDLSLSPIDNKFCLEFVNDFEDGKWRSKKFHRFIWDNVKETALSQKEREALSGKEGSILSEASAKLRITDRDKAGGEIAEILLYGIMKTFYGALPVVPKIFYKQNVNDYAKGADSVHIVLETDGKFSLWLGEAKFYNSLEDARLYEIVSSVHDTITTMKISKENSIITNLQDLDMLGIPPNTLSEIKHLLSEDVSIDLLKPHLHVPIMLLHECVITKETIEWNEDYVNKLKSYYQDRATQYFKRQIAACGDINKYVDIKFHLMLFPVPEKNGIVEKFISKAKSNMDE